MWPPTSKAFPKVPNKYDPGPAGEIDEFESTGAMAVYDAEGNVTAILSPFDSFSTTQSTYTPPEMPPLSRNAGTTRSGTLKFGPRGSLESVPAGFSSSMVLVAGEGVGATMRDWGLLLMRHGGKSPDLWKEDYSMKYLGYTTDNGAFYYYNTEKDKNYEETILDLKAYTVKEKVPVKWILYDSWFYPKTNYTTKQGKPQDPAHGALNWTDADPKIFPHGLRYVYRATGWPVVGHGRAWAKDNVYAEYNGGKYPFAQGSDIENQTIGIPLTESFWDDLFENAKEWGLLQYQQDWMFTQAGMAPVLESATLGKQWRMQMTNALTKHGLRFGFGGVMPADWLMSTMQQSVTNGRVSNDYHANLKDAGALNWDIGVASVFCWALSVLPAKDGWWTMPEQPGHAYNDNRTEPYGALHAAVATLSRGPVSPADKIGMFNRTQIMRTCMEDGTLLSPDIPATSLDSQLVTMALGGKAARPGPNGGIWATFTEIGNGRAMGGSRGVGLRYDHVLVPLLRARYTLTAEELWRHTAGRHGSSGLAVRSAGAIANAKETKYVVVENGAHGAQAHRGAAWFGPDAPIVLNPCSQSDFKMYHTTPLLGNGWGYVGELDKHVPVSNARVRTISTTEASLKVLLSGVPGEVVALTFVNGGSSGGSSGVLPLIVVNCTFGAAGIMRATPEGCSSEAFVH